MPRKQNKTKQIEHTEKPVETKNKKEVDWKGIVVFALIFLIAAEGVYLFFHSKKASAATNDTDYQYNITVNGNIFAFRNPIEDFNKVETFPNDLHIAFSVTPKLDYYKLEWSDTCEISQTCGIISISAFDISRAIRFNYEWQTANKDYVAIKGNNSVTVFFNKADVVESNLSKLNGLDIVFVTPGETNRTKLSYYERENSGVVIVEGNDTNNFLRAVDKFNYLVLRNVQSGSA